MASNKMSRNERESRATDITHDTVPTGIAGLDTILQGGVRKGNIILVEGAPGTGKTTLGLEFIYRGAKEYDEPGLVVSFELSPQKLLRDAAGFGWDFKSLEESGKVKVIYTSPLVILQELNSHDGVLANEIKRIGAKRFVIDGLTPLKVFGELFNGRPFRDSLHLLVEGLQRMNVTAVLTRELTLSGGPMSSDTGHEQFVCDTVISLKQRSYRRGMNRSIEVTKSRGQEFISGQHTMRIVGSSGVQVFNRPQARPREITEQPTSTKRISTGSKELDQLVGGGVFEGSITLAVGISGTGKTVSGVQFLMEGVRKGRRGLLVTLDEHEAQLIRNAEGLGFKLASAVKDGDVIIHYDAPLELELDVHFHDIVNLIEKHKIDLVVIDSLAAYEAADENESRDFIYALATYFKNNLITAYFNYETPELLGISQISENLKASTIVDNIILLNYVEISTQLRRAITVPKARGSRPDHRTREFEIGPGGIRILEDHEGEAGSVEKVPQLPFSAYYGILARSPSRRSPIVESYVNAGASMPRSAMPKAKASSGRKPVSRGKKSRKH